MRSLLCSTILALLGLTLTTPARADCNATCSNGSCTFDGILNTPIGSATLSFDGACRLVVSGIGSSLVDGVIQSDLNSVYMVTTLATPNFSGSLLGTRADITQVGVAGGVAGRTLSVTTMANVTGNLVRIDMDCSTIAVAAYSTEIYDAAGLVFSQRPGLSPPILILPKTDIVAMACALLPDGELYTTLKLGANVPIQIQTTQGTLGPFTGSCVKMRGYSPKVVPTLQEAIENRFKDTGPVSIVSLFAGPLPSVDVVCPLAPVFAGTKAVQWNRVLLDCVRRSKLGPPMVARAIGVAHTCGFDAWAMYDDVAIGTRVGGTLRRPAPERTQANKEKAFSYGEYRALLDLFPSLGAFIRMRMASLGYDPDDASSDPATPQGIGNVCAMAVTDFRHHDGSNQLGDLHTGAYSDYTGYAPVNTVDQIVDPNRWQPLRFSDGAGGFVVPGFIGPHWGEVVPFALSAWDQFHLDPPARYPHGKYIAQAENVLQLNAHLDDARKMIAEYWADGPRSELPPGHWTLFAEFVSIRDRHAFDQDVKMFFCLGNAVQDAGIAVWGAKRFYDSERPITAIRFLKAGKRILAYVPFQGKTVINGEDWLPYQPSTFITPPFAEYPSGHSAFSAAGAEILARFTGSDQFGGSATFAAGSSRVEPGFAPSSPVTLSWSTFSEAADEAGLSRRYGGIHFEQGDLDSRRLGRLVAGVVWDKAQAYIHGATTVPVATIVDALVPPAAPIALDAGRIEAEFAIAPIRPNPVRDEVRIDYVVPREARIRLTIVDLQGRERATLADGIMSPGRHQATWIGVGRSTVPAGIYFVRFQTPSGDLVRRVIVAH